MCPQEGLQIGWMPKEVLRRPVIEQVDKSDFPVSLVIADDHKHGIVLLREQNDAVKLSLVHHFVEESVSGTRSVEEVGCAIQPDVHTIC